MAARRNSASGSKVFHSHYGRDLCRADSFEKSTSMNVVVMVSFVGGLAGRKESLWIAVCWRRGSVRTRVRVHTRGEHRTGALWQSQ